jgi:adenine phosphoribosyltransferase
MADLKQYITDIPNFPQEGIIFRDITSLLQNPDGFNLAIEGLREKLAGVEFDSVAGLDARGFLFASPIAYTEHKGLIPVRKKGKLPRETVSQSYALEYGTAEVEIHTDSVKPNDRVVIIDDLIATGGTIEATIKLVERLGGKVVKVLSIIELEGLNGRDRLKGYDVDTLISYSGK